jgi:16S rRNA (uracil1498-N3)-methyltransferase
MLKAAADYPLVLFAHPDSEAQPLRRVLASYPALSRVALVVGSEGGFSPDEVQAAKDAGFVVASLGERILRCETAPLFLLSTLAYTYELPL